MQINDNFGATLHSHANSLSSSVLTCQVLRFYLCFYSLKSQRCRLSQTAMGAEALRLGATPALLCFMSGAAASPGQASSRSCVLALRLTVAAGMTLGKAVHVYNSTAPPWAKYIVSLQMLRNVWPSIPEVSSIFLRCLVTRPSTVVRRSEWPR